MKIYIVFLQNPERDVLGVYSSLELAKECKIKNRQVEYDTFIETYTLDKNYV